MMRMTVEDALRGSRGLLVGSWVTIAAPEAIDSASAAGVDFIGIDAQHSLLSVAEAMRLSYCAASNTPTFVRTPANDAAQIGQVLDGGASGVIVPAVETAAQAALAVAACHYPPVGSRSYGPIRPGLPREPALLEQRASCFVMIETAEGLTNVDEISRVAGLTGLFIGLTDLALSLGLPLAADDLAPKLESAIIAVAEACSRQDLIAGGFFRGNQVACAAALGYRLAIVTSDRLAMLTALKAQIADGRRAARAATLDR